MSAIEQLDTNAISSVQLMELLGIFPEELSIPSRFQQLQNVISYFKGKSPDFQRFIIKKITSGKNIDKLQFTNEYVELQRRKDILQNEFENLSKETGQVLSGSNDSIPIQPMIDKYMDVKGKLDMLNSEIAIYEK